MDRSTCLRSNRALQFCAVSERFNLVRAKRPERTWSYFRHGVIVLPGCLSRFRPSGFGHRGFTVASCLPVFRYSCIGDYFRQTSGRAVLCSLRRVEK